MILSKNAKNNNKDAFIKALWKWSDAFQLKIEKQISTILDKKERAQKRQELNKKFSTQHSARVRAITEKFATGKHSKQEWEQLKAKFHYTCAICGKQEPEIVLQKDHIKPLSRGGGNDIQNIQPLCVKCNHKKGPHFLQK